MHLIGFNQQGNYFAAIFFSVLPLLILLAGLIMHRRGAGEEKWLIVRQYLYLPIVVPLVIYYAIVYRWLFYEQFYRIKINNDNWHIEYSIPNKTKTIRTDDISSIRAVGGDIWTYKMVRILITTRNEKQYLSAQVGESDKNYYIDLLKKHADIKNFDGVVE
jgi:hypothetical protein